MLADKYSENILMTTEKGMAERKYWLSQLQGQPSVSCFPKDNNYTEQMQTAFSTFSMVFPDKVFHSITKISNKSDYAAYMILAAGVVWLLHKYTSGSDIIVGMPSFRQKSTGEYTENVLPLRAKIAQDVTFKSLLEQIKQAVLDADNNQNLPLSHVAELLGLHTEADYKYRFNTIVRMDSIHSERFNECINADVVFSFSLEQDSLKADIQHDMRVLGRQTILRILNHLERFLLEAISRPDKKLSDIDMMSPEEKQRILFDFNDTKVLYPKNKTIQQLFEEQVRQTPDAAALVFGEEVLSYKQLNERANQLARVLRHKGVKPNRIVGVMVERSIEMIVSILGVLKAGGAYLPIDPQYPAARIRYMLTDSQTDIVLTQNTIHIEPLLDDGTTCMTLVHVDDRSIYTGGSENLDNISEPTDLAYIIYTSGSTGKPKGVMLEHTGIASLREFFRNEFEINTTDRIVQFASISFDASVWEIFMALLTGASLHLVSEETIKNPDQFQRFINEHGITVATLPPTYLANLDPQSIGTLRTMITAGSSTTRSLVEKWKSQVVYINAYGPTETTICTTTFTCDETTEQYHSVPIGKPIYNTRVYIVDKDNRIVPEGVAGELCVSGDTLARGYLNRPNLTREKFVPNPYAEGEMMYRTGDLAKWMPDGNIEFLGRVDHQVKVRGYRIETGEIEACLRKHKDVKEVIVMARDGQNGDKYLCAYIVALQRLKPHELKQTLAEELPQYMIPSFFIQIDAMPLSPNGKVDIKALPMPDEGLYATREYVAPSNDLESKLEKIWAEVLGLESVSIKDSFFELGGDSIKAIQVLSRLNSHSLKLELKDLYQHKTIEEVAKTVTYITVKQIDQGPVSGEVSLTPAQRWFFNNGFSHMHHWNQSVMLRAKAGFDVRAVEKAFKKISAHHDALRMVYREEQGRIIQYNRDIDEGEAISIEVYDLISDDNYCETIQHKADALQESIRLETGPLVKLALFKTPEGDHLLIVIHHLVVDGVSWRIILEDFKTAYDQAIHDEETSLPNKTSSFQEWSLKLVEYANSKEIKKEYAYWRDIEAMDIPLLPVDYENKETPRLKDARSVEISLSREETQRILQEANKPYNTEINDLLLTALALAINKWTNQDTILINLEGHGREDIIKDVDITRTVGWFTSQYPVRIDLSEKDDISYLLRSVKEEIRKIPNKGIGYGILRYLSEDSADSIEFKNNPEICFNYLGQFEQAVDTELFGLSTMSTGQAMSPESENRFKLNINGIVTDGRLILSILYDQNQYERMTIQNLAENYQSSLCRIIDHCVSTVRRKPTPSDVGCKELTIKQFEPVYHEWGDLITRIYRLSPTQEGILFHAILDAKSHTYFQQIAFTIKGVVEPALLEKSFNIIVDRHDILRTHFIYQSLKRPLQVVLSRSEIKINIEDISHLDEASIRSYVEDYWVRDRDNGFDLSKDQLIRLTLVKRGKEDYTLIWSFHHILMDGWCIGIINKELFEIYTALKKNMYYRLGKAPHFINYINWLETHDEDEAREYWTRYLEGYGIKAGIPSTRARKTGKYKREEYSFRIDEEMTSKLTSIAAKNNTTLNIVLQAIWGIILQKYNRTNDVVFGAVMSGRSSEIEGIEEMLGLFINTVPVRVHCSTDTPLITLLGNMQQAALWGEKYSYYPLVEIQEAHALKGALFDHILVFENYPIEKNLLATSSQNQTGFSVEDVKTFQQTNYSLCMTIFPANETGFTITYNADVLDRDFVQSIESHIKQAAETIIDDPSVTAGAVELLKTDEKNRILFGFNQTGTDYPRDETICRLFERQANSMPGNVAVVFEGRHITYQELNQKANQLARILQEQGMCPEEIVGIRVTPSIEMVIGILGVLKAGYAYLPIDPDIPSARVKQIALDSGASLILTQSGIAEEDLGIKQIELDAPGIYRGDIANLGTPSDPHSLVYVIYTSGTTGKPKGVQVEDRSLVNYIHWFSARAGLTCEDKTVLVSSFAFDLGYTSLYSSLLNGCALHLMKKEHYSNPRTLLNYIEQNGITYVKATPSLFSMLVNDRGFHGSNESSPLRLVVLGGEQMVVGDVEKFHNRFSNVKIMNHYGPSETTIGSIACMLDFERFECYKQSPVIGKPINNTQVYILDDALNPVPVGVPGEIYISGDGVSRGYLNRPDLTAGKFIVNRFEKTPKRMYKTGDLGRYHADGAIEFLGRKDNQVKIRGYRVELTEIEACLLKYEKVKDGAVVARDDNGSKYICAYIVHDEDVTISEIRKQLEKELPDYMIPSFFVSLDRIPLTPNGKVDTKALPSPSGSAGTSVEYIPPGNELEKILTQIWQEVLGVEKIGIDHNFFEMGGHSLKIIQLISGIYEAFHVEISPRQVIEAPTVREMARRMAEGSYKEQHPLMLLNENKDRKVFCFPPVGGYGLVYKSLADLSDTHAYHSFNYIEDSSNHLHLYVQYIKEVQPEGPYVLMGWSAGGNLAFEVVKEMESQGHEVSDLILIDAHRTIRNANLSEEEIKKIVAENLAQAEQDVFYKDYLGKNSFIRKTVAAKMEDFFTYLRNDMINSGKVKSNIHMILSTDEIPQEQDLRRDWYRVTAGKFLTYQGTGSHSYMLYSGAVEENARIIGSILTTSSVIL
ncbi:MAG: amino acid adenylation domain-containing protein [Clostridiaceae bacterium]|nr:amino acid adenylation domain-containing protein [Clostridiaceae bacterium]